MEKINKEELMKKLNLTEEELEKVAGGTMVNSVASCREYCDDLDIKQMDTCEQMYQDHIITTREGLDECIMSSYTSHINCLKACEPIAE